MASESTTPVSGSMVGGVGWRRGGRTFDDVGSLLLERLDGLLLELDGVLAHQDLDVKVFVLEEFMGDDVTEATGGADEEDVLGEGHSLSSSSRWRSEGVGALVKIFLERSSR